MAGHSSDGSASGLFGCQLLCLSPEFQERIWRRSHQKSSLSYENLCPPEAAQQKDLDGSLSPSYIWTYVYLEAIPFLRLSFLLHQNHLQRPRLPVLLTDAPLGNFAGNLEALPG